MPELPEVEFAARSLRRWLARRTIVAARAPDTRVFRGSDRHAFERELPGKTLDWIERRGKWLLLAFTGNVGLLAHLGMTGKWLRVRSEADLPTHVRARLDLDDGRIVCYRDPRLFGRIVVHPADRLFDRPEIRALGPDPLVDGLDPDALHERLRKSQRPIKVALLDQGLIAGVGNIQATEALFLARIHPARPAASLDAAEVRALVEAIDRSIRETLAAQGEGETIAYVEEPGAENPFRVYGRAGSPCPRCGATLEKIEIGGRTSAFCPREQRL